MREKNANAQENKKNYKTVTAPHPRMNKNQPPQTIPYPIICNNTTMNKAFLVQMRHCLSV